MIEKEIEIKFVMNDHIKEKLKYIQTTPYEEKDEYFTTKDMLDNFTFLRIRHKKGKIILQLKDITAKERTHYEADEIHMELSIEDTEKMRAILKTTFPFNFIVKKIRNKGFLNDCEICIDNVEQLGDFLEIEGPKEKIIELCKQFELTEDMQDKEKGYAIMMAKKTGFYQEN